MTHDKPAAHFAPDEKSANLEAQTMPDTQAQDATRKPGTASAGAPDSMATRFFRAAARMGPLLLLILLLAQIWPTFLGNNFYYPHEARSILIFSQTAQNGQWLAPAAGDLSNGLFFPGFWPRLPRFFPLLPPRKRT